MPGDVAVEIGVSLRCLFVLLFGCCSGDDDGDDDKRVRDMASGCKAGEGQDG